MEDPSLSYYQYTQRRSPWDKTDRLILNLLRQRRELLRMGSEFNADNLKENQRLFCQALMSYFATAHFAVYPEMAKAGDLNGSIYNRILKITKEAVAFNDKYGLDAEKFQKRYGKPLEFSELKNDLSKLMEHLFVPLYELENMLINHYKELTLGKGLKAKPMHKPHPT